ncbi:hypothetical protein SAMN05444008_10548 [Cnuella takakiae]|uniref:Secreted protein n=1 Tax=Cnuella takakiae TaxID=1302690 RepID=A0A1M4Z0S4_9BACT|nr:hypothetical protein [Cnuella takakiae]OLY94363.1 hypothetical protein BUE76_22620 [Cnuella takakiae]SHF11654.1 hypothetical protein SAMN05444008_10548 [Cnuella takakiae]
MNTRILGSFICALLLSTFTRAQVPEQKRKEPLSSRVSTAPESVFSLFRDAGMNPVNHPLHADEKAAVEKAIAILPPLHQRILQMHLHSISFMDSMPNNALTSLLESGDSAKQFNITFRAGMLSETISEWVAKKEYTSFSQAADQEVQLIADAGTLNAIQYVFLHEATHIVDAVLNLTTHPDNSDTLLKPTPFTKGTWRKRNQPVPMYTDLLLDHARQRNRSVSIVSAPAVYRALQQTPFTSLYSMAAWSEDIAELVTIYHLTRKLKQPYRIIVKKNNTELASFEPMRNKLVRKRLKLLRQFYDDGV